MVGDNNVVSCDCRNNLIRYNRIQFANIPVAFKDIRLNTFNTGYYENKEQINIVVKIIKYYLEHLETMKAEGIGLYLFSETKGSGKTRMATSLANELMQEHDMTVRFTTSLDILSEIKATWNNDAEFKSESQLLHYLNTAEVLVIDDFGTENIKDWKDEKFYQIINTRYISKLITIYTSNYSLDELEYNDRITNRIKERVYQVRFPEESIRDGIAAAREKQMIKDMEGAE